MPRLKLAGWLIRFAYNFVDIEASWETASPDKCIIEYAFVISKLSLLPKERRLDVGCTAKFNYVPVALGWKDLGNRH